MFTRLAIRHTAEELFLPPPQHGAPRYDQRKMRHLDGDPDMQNDDPDIDGKDPDLSAE